VDDAFVAFKARRRVLAADESCSCRACRSVGSLDLKIIAHHGAFLRQTVADGHSSAVPRSSWSIGCSRMVWARRRLLLLTEAALA